MPEDRFRHEFQVLGVAQSYPTTVTFGQIDHIYDVALLCARGCGIRADNAEDTSQEFGNCWLAALREDKPWARRCLYSEAYLRRCAYYHAKDTAAKLQGLYYRELQWSPTFDDEDAACIENRSCQQPGPDKQVIRMELQAVLFNAILRLQERPQEIVLRRVILRQKVINIAQQMGCTPHAVSESLNSSGDRLEMYLIMMGYTEAEVREYLYELFRPVLSTAGC